MDTGVTVYIKDLETDKAYRAFSNVADLSKGLMEGTMCILYGDDREAVVLIDSNKYIDIVKEKGE